MRKGSPNHFRAARLLLCALTCAGVVLSAAAQANTSQTADLLNKANAAESRGRMDMARDSWSRVLLMDPNNPAALAGMARAAKSEGNLEESAAYLSRLRQINPNDPHIRQVEGMSTAQAQSSQEQEAGRLAQAGEYARAMEIQRQMYGTNPPPGDAALSYYQTEAGAPQGRAHAVAGLRSLAARFPQDSRYEIALAKILTYTPATRREGRRLLEKYPYDPNAMAALRESLVWDAQNPAASGDIRAYLSRHPDPQLEAELARAAAGRPRGGGRRGAPLTPEQRQELAAATARNAEERAAYALLNAHKYAEADARFKDILANHPQSCQALAGLGYVRMSQGNFAGAISFLEQAQQDGCKEGPIERALHDSRFFYTIQVASTALNDNDLFTAQKEFELALKLRPNDPSALLGLGGTMLKAQQPDQALPIFAEYVRLAPGDQAAWRGLLMAQYGAGKYNEALETERRIPPPVKAQLVRDPDYLRTLASVYIAENRDAEAQRIFELALSLPFPNGGHDLKVDVQLQYAALLATAGRREQAAGLYHQVLQADPNNTNAWAGLVQAEHGLGHDAEAYRLLQQMPPQILAGVMQEAGFETTVAAIYEGSGHDELAEEVLEKLLARQQAEGKKLFVPAEVQLASIYVRLGNYPRAYATYRLALQNDPSRPEAWVGLLQTLHSTEHDQDALAQIQQIPPGVRRELENDPAYLQAVGSIYSGLGDSRQAMVFFNRVQQRYATLRIAAPADIQIQQAWLLYNTGADASLYQQLMMLGGRQDLTNHQRLIVQTIWTNWAVRRANQNVAAGNYRRAIAILNATAKSFPGNPEVIRALASGYASAGMPKEAVAIFRSQNLNAAPVADYRAAVGAALAANDVTDAEIWLRFGLEQYPKDAPLLILAGKFEQARGDANRAADYYRASLAVLPAENPGAQLATELSRPAPAIPATLPSSNQPQDLATLLSQPDKPLPGESQPVQRPYLPSFTETYGNAPVPMGPPQQGSQQGYGYPAPQPSAPAQSGAPVLRDYMPPQSRLERQPVKGGAPATHAVLHLHPSPEMEAKYGPYLPYDPSAGVPHFTNSRRALGDGVLVTASKSQAPITAHFIQAAYEPQQTSQESAPVVQYIPPAHPPAKPVRSASQAAKARAESIRANQAQGQGALTGQSHPPVENYNPQPSATLNNTQFSSQPYDPAQVQGSQVAQPQSRPVTSTPAPVQQTAPPVTMQQQQPIGPDTYGQQYPQPGTGGTPGQSGWYPRRKVATHKAAPKPQAAPASPAPIAATPSQPQQPAMSYPTPGEPLSNVGYPQTGTAYPMGAPPSDYDLQQRNLPPLRGYFDPRADERAPLTQRQQAELALATIEGSYSGWVGGTAIGHYRSGTAGIDRLGSLEVPIEISLVAGKTLRLSIIPKAVFLNSGKLDTLNSNLGSQAVLGTFPGNATTPPAQQFASGIGGEVQVATNTFSAAVGVTPYEFLVTNIIGRGQWRPLSGHFMFFGGRDPVRETQLSYAGLRDPGSASAVYSGNVWGGVVSTGGGVRFDAGGERSGIYLQGEGNYLTGFHTLDNRKFDGTMGMYFRAKSWPEYGSLTIGGLFYGMHFEHNERGETYGLGGYFSPEAYFLAAVPITFNGHYGNNLHYMINSSVGVQTFEEDNQIFFPLDPALQTSALSACSILQITARTCAQQPVNSSTGLNYSFDSEVSYRVTEHWFVGGFLSANNTNNYNSVTGGFFARYLFRPQVASPDYPTGLFPVEGFRPLQVP